ncbi:hypothetical protein MW871_10990 [Flavobacterium sp. I-SCBP12n]|uniref:Uncharacterized protein n=2 Tax=Flavobacterium TaxID=237 RepID=A0A9X2BLW1_9FLAO|nr:MULTISPECIES: hypothetical protein [Flavobacterium]MBP4142194.1 hypothetical protein [Flavobacterium flabelliforme]MCK8142417.1 hypothetical protein [Flavobacterium pygoscelis]
MKTENQLTIAILEITMKIRNEYPELIKYLAELPVTIPDISNPEINTKVLMDYYQSLENIIKKYSSTHTLS